MVLGLVSERPSGAGCPVCQGRPEGRSRARRIVAECVAVILVASISLAYAILPDSSWIPGIYDGYDCDDVVGMWTDATAISDSRARQRVERVFVGFVIRSATGRVASPTVQRQTIRGPPIDTRDASVDVLLTLPATAPAVHLRTPAESDDPSALALSPTWACASCLCLARPACDDD